MTPGYWKLRLLTRWGKREAGSLIELFASLAAVLVARGIAERVP